MTELYKESAKEREIYFREAAVQTGISFQVIEKDYWVVWTLGQIFSLKGLGPHLTFKGGTSLSKAYRIIERFSEDIDISIEKEFLGFDKENDPEKAGSKKKQKKVLEALAKSCSEYVQSVMLHELTKRIETTLGRSEKWELTLDPKDPDKQTILFHYPNISPKEAYIEQSVKIEIGARSEHWPVSEHKIQSYLKEALEDKVDEAPVTVKVLNAERTFWEKATILHQYANIPSNKILPPRISRHYYDFYCLLNSDFKKIAIDNQALLERVAIHKSIYFASAWASYETACKGTLKLIPPPHILKLLEADFQQMKVMFFGKIPEWKTVVDLIQNFETEFNK